MPEGCSEQRLVLEGGAGRVPAPVGAGARRPWGRWGGGVQARVPGEARPAMVEAEGGCLSLGRLVRVASRRSALCGSGKAKGTLLSPGDGTSAGSNKRSRAGVSGCRVWGRPCSDCSMTLNVTKTFDLSASVPLQPWPLPQGPVQVGKVTMSGSGARPAATPTSRHWVVIKLQWTQRTPSQESLATPASRGTGDAVPGGGTFQSEAECRPPALGPLT